MNKVFFVPSEDVEYVREEVYRLGFGSKIPGVETETHEDAECVVTDSVDALMDYRRRLNESRVFVFVTRVMRNSEPLIVPCLPELAPLLIITFLKAK